VQLLARENLIFNLAFRLFGGVRLVIGSIVAMAGLQIVFLMELQTNL
jgi:hypothetical protein